MEIQVTGRHVSVTKGMKDYVRKKLERIGRFNLRFTGAHVIMDVEKYRHRVEVTLQVDHTRIHGEEVSEDMYQSVDKVLDKIERQLRKYKQKFKNRKTKQIRPTEIDPSEVSSDSVKEEKFRPKLVKTEKFAVKPMDLDEAVLQMERSKEGFVMFRNAETEKVNVIYRRHDGDFGLIEPSF